MRKPEREKFFGFNKLEYAGTFLLAGVGKGLGV